MNNSFLLTLKLFIYLSPIVAKYTKHSICKFVVFSVLYELQNFARKKTTEFNFHQRAYSPRSLFKNSFGEDGGSGFTFGDAAEWKFKRRRHYRSIYEHKGHHNFTNITSLITAKGLFLLCPRFRHDSHRFCHYSCSCCDLANDIQGDFVNY